MLYKNKELLHTIMQSTLAINSEEYEQFMSRINKYIDDIIHQMYCYGCIFNTIDRDNKIFEVSIPEVCELNRDGTDPLFEHTASRCYITRNEMIEQIRHFTSILTNGSATLSVTIRNEVWTAEKYKQYIASKEENKMADSMMAVTGVLHTIQKRDKLNVVARVGEAGPGGAYHDYEIRKLIDEKMGEAGDVFATISFQKGPRKVEDSRHGVIDEDLLEIVRDRLTAFQQGEFATRENKMALMHIEEALMWMNKRKEDRAERGVLGTYNK